MAVGATFQPSQGADPIGNIQSYMQRAQNYRAQEQQMQQEKAKFQAFLPAIVAKRNADVVSAQASIANATRMEQLRGKAAETSADYNDRFLNILSIPDEKDRSDTLGAFMGEIAWLDNPALPEYQGFARAVKDERAKSYTEALTNMKLDQHLQETQEAIQGRVDKAMIDANARRDTTGMVVEGRRDTANIRGSYQQKIAEINSDTRLSIEDKRAKKQGIQLEDLQNRAAEADQMASDAQRDGDVQLAQTFRQNAASLRDAIQKTTTFAGSTPSAPRDASQDPRPTARPSVSTPAPALRLGGLTAEGRASGEAAPSEASPSVAPTKVPKTATSVSIGGKDYPVFKDANGNRAYKIDGHYVPIQSE